MVIDREATNMNHNNRNVHRWTTNTSIGVIIAILSFNVTAETMHYYDNGNQRSIQLQPSLVAEFAGSTSAQTRSTENTIIKPFVSIHKNTSPTRRTAGSTANQSPVFREGDSPAGRLMALPGGVIVNFKPDWTDEQVRLWTKTHDYLIKQKLNILGNWYIIDTPPGLVSLQAANDIQETGEVVSASPNWWKETANR